MKNNYLRISQAICLGFVMLITASCEKLSKANEAIDEAIEEMLGITALSEELDTNSSNFSKVEDIVINGKDVSWNELKMKYPASVPYSFLVKRFHLSGSIWKITTTNYTGSFPKMLLTIKNVTNIFKIVVQNNTPKVSVNNVSAASPVVGKGSGGNSEPEPGGVSTILVDKELSGDIYELKTLSFTLPVGVKTMTIKTTEPGLGYRNSADMFVRKGSPPIVAGPKPPSELPKYAWTADCSGVKPNRESEVCTFTNPGAGTWYVSLYGYNTYFVSQVIVTITI